MSIVKNISTDINVYLNSKELRKIKDKGEKANEEMVDDSEKGQMFFEDTRFEIDEIYFDENEETLHMGGDLRYDGVVFGDLHMDLDIPLEVSIDLIAHYIKKLSKLKTVMEAVK